MFSAIKIFPALRLNMLHRYSLRTIANYSYTRMYRTISVYRGQKCETNFH